MTAPALVERVETRPIYLPPEEASPFPWKATVLTGVAALLPLTALIVAMVAL